MSLEARIAQLETEVSELKQIIKWSHSVCDSCQKILNPSNKCDGCEKVCCLDCDFYNDEDLSGYCTIACARVNWQNRCANSCGYFPEKHEVDKIKALLDQKERE